ncbi:MAG: AAA family ATPase, partial [Candidatus Dormibacteraceae bacterium]
GIGGTNGSGKDTLSQILADDYGWLFVSASDDLIIPELERRGLPLEREQMAALTAEWNRASKGFVIDKAIEKFEQESKSHKFNGLVISSIRHPWESDRIHALGGKVVWVDGDPKVRYNRIFTRGQGDKDQKSFEQFLAEEQAEMEHSGDEATLNMAAVKAAADVFLINSDNDLEKFKAQAQKALNL